MLANDDGGDGVEANAPASPPPLSVAASGLALLARRLLSEPLPALKVNLSTTGAGYIAREWRGDGSVELLDLRSIVGLVPEHDIETLGEARKAALAHNEQQHATHALCHALHGLRDICVILARACGELDYSLPRLTTAEAILDLLPSLPPVVAAVLAPPLCEAATACLGGLGPTPLLPPPAHLRLLNLARNALDPSSSAISSRVGRAPAPTSDSRREIYVVLLTLLRIALPPAEGAWCHPQQQVLRAQATAALRSSPGVQPLMETIALDARDGPTLLRGIALSLLTAMLDFEEMTDADTQAVCVPPLIMSCLCRSPFLSEMLAPLSNPESELNQALTEMLISPTGCEPSQHALTEAWRFHTTITMVTRLLTRLASASKSNPSAEWASALLDDFLATGAVAHLPRAKLLSLPLAYLCDADDSYGTDSGDVEAISSESAAAAHARMVTPLIRALSASLLCGARCGSEAAHRQAATAAAEALGGDNLRASTTVRILRAPFRFPARSTGRLTALRTAMLVARTLAAIVATHPAILERAHGKRLLMAAARLLGSFAAALSEANADAKSNIDMHLPTAAQASAGLAAGGGHDVDVLALRFAPDGPLSTAANAAATEAASIENVLGQLLSFVHAGARPPLSTHLLFAPSLREGGALAPSAPPVAALCRLLDASRNRLIAADESVARLDALGGMLPSLTAQKLRQILASLADMAGGAVATAGPPPAHFDQPQLARCASALVASATVRESERAVLHLGCLERTLLLLHQHLVSWNSSADQGEIPPTELRELRNQARRGAPSRGASSQSLSAMLTALLQQTPSRALTRHEEQLALVSALARKCLELLN